MRYDVIHLQRLRGQEMALNAPTVILKCPIENVLLGISPASNCSWPTFRNPVSVPSSKAGGRLWGVRGSKV